VTTSPACSADAAAVAACTFTVGAQRRRAARGRTGQERRARLSSCLAVSQLKPRDIAISAGRSVDVVNTQTTLGPASLSRTTWKCFEC
jgi:hypothetical protein